MSHEVTLRYLGGVERRMSVGADQTILEAAEANGLPIVNECQSGVCGTCIGACSSGRYEMGRAEGLSDVEREAGKLLTCQTTVQSDCVLELQYPFGDNAAQLLSGEGRVIAVEQVSPTTALLRIAAAHRCFRSRCGDRLPAGSVRADPGARQRSVAQLLVRPSASR